MQKKKDSKKELKIIKSGDILSQYYKEPLNQKDIVNNIIDVFTGIGASVVDPKEVIYSSNRLLKGLLGGEVKKTLINEIKILQDRGRAQEDLTKNKYAISSLVELFEFIDSEVPDNDRLEAVKAIFFYVISRDLQDNGKEILRYQLLQIIKKLTSHQLLILKVSYEAIKDNGLESNMITAWYPFIARKIGHNNTELVKNDESALVDYNLISSHDKGRPDIITKVDCRLTPLGVNLCEVINKYNFNNLIK